MWFESVLGLVLLQRKTKMSLLLLSLLVLSKKGAQTFPTEMAGLQEFRFSQVDSNILGGPRIPFGTAVPVTSKLWPDARIPYRILGDLGTLLTNVRQAMQIIENKTCIRFVDVSPDHTSYINITLKEGCWSNVGRVMGAGQELSLGRPCGESLGVVLHELLHALGLWHEHARSDRDDYVEVLWNNIQEGEKGNFEKLQPWVNNLLEEPFDFDSIMLYGSMSFSKDGTSQTLVSRVPGKHLIDLTHKYNLSEGDVRRLNRLYECNGENRPNPVEVPSVTCPFQNDFCEFTNQESQDLVKWTLAQDGGVVLSWTDNQQESYIAGRLFSTYLKSYHRDEGCLSFKLRFNGPAVKGIWVYKQTENEEEQTLLENDSEGLDSDTWLQMAIPVPLNPDFRLIFQGAILSGGSTDNVMLKDLEFVWKSCS